MSIRSGHREQEQFLPPSIEQYVPEDAPVRVYDAFVESLDLGRLGIERDLAKVGNPSYDPKAMLKLLIYGYSYGVRSSRKLERETHYNLSFIWLMGGLKPDHKTIAEFRRKNKKGIKRSLVECARMAHEVGLIEGDVLFIDGSKMRGNASIKNTWTREKCRRVEERIEEIMAESEVADKQEEGQPSLVKVSRKAAKMKEGLQKAKEQLEKSERKVINTVDPDCARINSVQGTGAGYNMEVVVDDKNGLIVSSDVVSANNDIGQFSEQICKAEATLGSRCGVAVADSGFADTDDLKKVDEQGIRVVVPTQRLASGKEIGEFDKRGFCYYAERDCFFCPMGEELGYTGISRRKKGRIYRVVRKGACERCVHFGICTTSKKGRRVMRLIEEEVRERLERQYQMNRDIYERRKGKVELVFGHIKRNLGVRSFLLRGLEGVQAEAALLSLCFNLVRMRTLLGAKGLIERLRKRRELQYA